MKTLVLVDFDRTLFNTASFYRVLLDSMQKKSAINDEQHTNLEQLVTGSGITKPLQLLIENGISYELFKSTALGLGKNFLYEDWQVITEISNMLILTTSYEPKLQEVKIQLSGLDGYPFQIVEENKGEFLARQLDGGRELQASITEYDRVILVDDNAKSLQPLKNYPIVLVQLIREDAVYPDHSDFTTITSLEEIWPLLKQS